MNSTTTPNFNKILKTIQALKQKVLQNEKLSTVLREISETKNYNTRSFVYVK